MTVTLKLPVKLKSKLNSKAKAEGVALGEYIVKLLAEADAAPKPKTGKELEAIWRKAGIFGSRPDIKDAQAYSRELRRKAEQRSRDL